MSIASLIQAYEQSYQATQLNSELEHFPSRVHLKGLVGTSLSLLISNTFKQTDLPFLFILNDKEEAAYYLNDLEQLLGDTHVLFTLAVTGDHTKLKKQIMQMYYFVLKF